MFNIHKSARKLRLKMVVALLCFAMNPACCFLQTLLGLVSYTNGLRDSGFEALNTFGCASSIDHIRTHGTFWAEMRNAIDEIDKKSFWRISFDNLNFKLT